MRIIDLTRTLTDGMAVYPGDPAVRLINVATIAQDGYCGSRINASVHAGTHLDAPAHFLENGKRVDELDAAQLIGRGRLVDARGETAIDAPLLYNWRIKRGEMVLVYTGWDTHFDSPDYCTKYPQVTPAFAHRLCDAGIAAVGFDSPGPDYPPHAAHRLFLEHGIAILENLVGLEQLISIPRFEIIALPAKWPTEGAPVRVVARIISSYAARNRRPRRRT